MTAETVGRADDLPVPPDSASSDSRLDVVIAVLLALVALTAALAAWRTSSVGSMVSDSNRSGLINVSKQAAMHHVNEELVYGQADFAARAAMKAAQAQSLMDSGDPALAASGQVMKDNLIPGMQKLGGDFPDGQHLTALGTYDIASAIAALESADQVYQQANPVTDFALADEYAKEKTWLTILSVLLAIALFWLGMAEITSGRWRLTNLIVGVAIWVLTLAAFAVVEAWFITGRGGAL